MDCDESSNLESSAPAPTPMLPKEMLEKIFERLSFYDLLNCREVNSTWKRAATYPLRKLCAPVHFSVRKHFPWAIRHARDWVVERFHHLKRATNEQGVLEDFPITEFQLNLNSKYYWMEMEGSALICHWLKAVSPFVKKIIFNLVGDLRQVPNNNLAILQDVIFSNLAEITLKQKNECEENPSGIFTIIRNVIEKSPNIKQLHLDVNNYSMLQCFEETGIMQKANLVTSLKMTWFYVSDATAFQHFIELEPGFKLTHLVLNGLWIDSESLHTFLKSQTDTLTSLTFKYGRYDEFKELPCLPHLTSVFIQSYIREEDGYLQPLPTFFYKEKLPALKTIGLKHEVNYAANYFMASHLASPESLQELILLEKKYDLVASVIQQAARVFPNLKKLQLLYDTARRRMRDICEELPGIEELCIVTECYGGVDEVITGLPESVLSKIRNVAPSDYKNYLSGEEIAMLEQKVEISRLENLKTLVVRFVKPFGGFVRHRECRGRDFARERFLTKLSGVVLTGMKSLQRIEFGIRESITSIDNDLRQDLESHGIKVIWGTSPRTAWWSNYLYDSHLHWVGGYPIFH